MSNQKTMTEPFDRPWWMAPPAESWAILAGIMMTTAMPPFNSTGWLAPLALAILFHALLDAPRPARAAWLFGLAHQTTLLYWMFLLVPASSIPYRWLVPVQASATILYVSLFYVVFGWAFRLLRQGRGRTVALLLVPLLWIAMEAWRGMGELGFPWCLSGAAWIRTPLLPLAATSGEIGLGAATAFTGAALVVAVDRYRGWRERTVGNHSWRLVLIGATALLWIGLVAGASWRAAPKLPESSPAAALDSVPPLVPRQTPVRIAAVQADVSLDYKWRQGSIDSTRIPYGHLTRAAAQRGAEFVVWAETAVPAYLMVNQPGLLEWLSQLVIDEKIFLYTGFPDARMGLAGVQLRYNSSGLFGPPYGFRLDGYDKHHLLPIGESMPFARYVKFLAAIDVGQAEWCPGSRPGPISVPADEGVFSFAGLICFESIFSDLARQAVRNGAQFLVNITNDGWFGQSAGPRQHADLSRFRAAECGVPVVRCANNGISFITDAKGHILDRADLGVRAVVRADVKPGGGGTLFIQRGAWPLGIFLGLWLVTSLLLGRRERPE
ncbi:MAG: apolipoprotein N-acyltransferase [bacterium]